MFDDIEKSLGGHKYVKRTGTPGNYKYWYKMPDGSLKASDDPSAAQQLGQADAATLHDKAKIEHLKRLIAAKNAGHHNMSKDQMAAHTGHAPNQVHNMRSNMRRTERQGGQSHDFQEHHLKESHHENVSGREYINHIENSHGLGHGTQTAAEHLGTPTSHAPAASATPTNDARRARRQAREQAAAPAAEPTQRKKKTTKKKATAKKTSKKVATSGNTEADALVRKLKEEHGIDLLGDSGNQARQSAAAIREAAQAPVDRQETEGPIASDEATISEGGDLPDTPAAQPAATETRYIPGSMQQRMVDAGFSEVGRDGSTKVWERVGYTVRVSGNSYKVVDPGGQSLGVVNTPEEARLKIESDMHDSVQAAVDQGMDQDEAEAAVGEANRQLAESARAIREAQSTSSPASRELRTVDPDFGRSEAAVERMVEQQSRGTNPYIARAREIFDRVKNDPNMKADRKAKVENLLAAISKLETQGRELNEANLLAAYKEDNPRVRTLPKSDFESATFVTLDEVLENAPVDPEVERMKRGYAAKQFARLKPFLKDSWKTSNPSAPPPMPTFGDIKSWSEHGGTKPSWAGNTKLALPEEVFNASHKSADGKPKYPPAWMPIHLMPAWNYHAKRVEADQGAAAWAYQGPGYAAGMQPQRDQSSPTGWKLDFGGQARSGAQFAQLGTEGMVIHALRKYVQQRGGVDQLTDIPKSKLSDLGITHADLFKGEGDDLMRALQTKIIDPVGLVSVLKELHGTASTSKSFGLYINPDEVYIPGEHLNKGESIVIDLRKARAEKIERILESRGAR